MLNSAKIVGFVPTQNLERARAFYADLWGLPVIHEDAFGVTLGANAALIRISIVGAFRPASFTILGWEVPDIRAAVEELARRGVRFERFDGLQQDESGIWTAPGGSRVAWIKDPDGNILSVSQHS
jgi:catechol 2,3-dioxygenase-like lactoylglutathione lyase family enzyme